MTDRFPICFTLDCDNLALPGKWFCQRCDDFIRQLAERDAKRSAERKAAEGTNGKGGRPRRPRNRVQRPGR